MSQNGDFYINTELNTDGITEGAKEIDKALDNAAQNASIHLKKIGDELVDVTGKTDEEIEALIKAANAAKNVASEIDNVAQATNKVDTGLINDEWLEVGNTLVNVKGKTQEEIDAIVAARTATQELSGEFNNVAEAVEEATDTSGWQDLSKSINEFFNETKKVEDIKIDTAGAVDIESPRFNMEDLDKYLSRAQTFQDRLNNYKYNLSEALTPLRNFIAQSETLSNTVIGLTRFISNFGNITKRVFSAVGTLARNLAIKGIHVLGDAFKRLGRMVGACAAKVLSLHRAHNKMGGGFKENLKHLIRYGLGISSLFILFNKLRKAITDGMQNLAKYDKKTNASISSLVSALATLKNTIATAFAPILNVVSPILTAFINQLINLANVVGQVIAALTGQSVFIKATKVQKDYANSLGKTGAAASKALLAIDELNQINTESGGGGGASPSDMFETVDISDNAKDFVDKIKAAWEKADFYDLGKGLADRINLGLQSIPWESIRATASKAGESLATFLNGIFEEKIKGERGLWSLGYTIGYTIGQAINTGIDFLYSFADKLHWASVGQFIADGVKGALETIEWRKLGSTISKLVNGFLTTLITFFRDSKMWKDLRDAIINLFNGIDWKQVAFNLSEFVDAVLDTMIDFLSDKELWSTLGASIGKFISGIQWKKVVFDLGKLAIAIAKAIKDALAAWAKEDPESFGIAAAIGVAIMAIKVASLKKYIDGAALATTIGTAIEESLPKAGFGLNLGLSAMLAHDINNLAHGNDLTGNPAAGSLWYAGNYSVLKPNEDNGMDKGNLSDLTKEQLEQLREHYEALNNAAEEYKKKYGDILGTMLMSSEEAFAYQSDSFSAYAESIGYNVDVVEGKTTTLQKRIAELKVVTEGIGYAFNSLNEASGGKLSAMFDDLIERLNLRQPLEDFKNSITETWENITGFMSEKKDSIVSIFQSMWDGITEIENEGRNGTYTGWQHHLGQINAAAAAHLQSMEGNFGKHWDKQKKTNADGNDSVEKKTKGTLSVVLAESDRQWKNIYNASNTQWKAMQTDNEKAFTAMQTKDIEASKKTAEGMDPNMNNIVSLSEGIANSIGDSFNQIADSIKSITTFDWTNPITGEHFSSGGISLPKIGRLLIPKIKLPFLANGTVVPRNASQFAAVLGDNNRETEVVSPLSTIQEAVANVMQGYLAEIAENTRELADKDFSVAIGDREIARAANNGQKLLGYSLIT